MSNFAEIIRDDKTANMDDRRMAALYAHLVEEGEDDVDFEDLDCSGCSVSYGRREWLVLTESEADAIQDDYFEDYIDEMLSPVDNNIARYFDRATWKHDARHDGRGCCIASYDGNEYESGEFFIYRIS